MFFFKRVKNYNPKAKEAFGKSLVDIGVSIYKNLFTLFLISPLIFISENIFNNNEVNIPIINIHSSLFQIMCLVFIISLITAEVLRNKGLYYINQSEH